MIEKTKKCLKPVGTRPGVMYGSCKVHKASVGNCPPFRPILSALNTPIYKSAKFLLQILKPLTTNEFTVKDSFHFAEEIVDQQHLFMGSSDVDFLFTNITLEETIKICTNEFFKEFETVEGLSKTEFKELFLWLLRICILFLMGHFINKSIVWLWLPPIDPTFANVFKVYHEKNWLEHCPLEYRPLYYQRYVHYIFVLFNSAERLKRFHSYLNSCHLNISFTVENEKDTECPFLTLI